MKLLSLQTTSVADVSSKDDVLKDRQNINRSATVLEILSMVSEVYVHVHIYVYVCVL